MKRYRAWAEINLKTVAENLQIVKNKVASGVKILVVLKADAYGHGAVPLAKTVVEHGAYMLGVGDSTEALELRQAGILSPILILGAIIEEELSWIVSYDIRPTIHTMDMLELLHNEAQRQDKKLKVHLKVDTGMTRLGASPKRALEIAKRIKQFPHLELEGLSTHFSSAHLSNEIEFTNKQLTIFTELSDQLEPNGLKIPLKHVANTGGIFAYNYPQFNMVRTGAAIYGIDPGNLKENSLLPTKPILTLKSQVTFLKTVPAGTPVGYGRTYVTAKRTRIATIPIGYNDGYPYTLSNKGYVLIRSQKAPIIGTVTMDYIMADVSHIAETKTGDEAVFIGQQGNEEITTKELARLSGLIPYAITCSLGKRIKRVYVES